MTTMSIRFGSVCSGIEGASVAWETLGGRAAWVAEVEAFPSAVIKYHYPAVPNLGDMTTIAAKIRAGAVEAPDVFVGGTPCQSFSVAGLRKGLGAASGQLVFSYIDTLNAIDEVRLRDNRKPCTALWENVPGCLSSQDNAFGCFLAGLAGEDEALLPPGGRWTDAGMVLGPQRAVAWRVLNSEHFGVAQRRRRVFVVASAREGFSPSTVLFEREGVRRDSPPSRTKGEAASTRAESSAGSGGVGFELGYREALLTDLATTLTTRSDNGPRQNQAATGILVRHPAAFSENQRGGGKPGQGYAAVLEKSRVRRLTPVECERLQAFPDNWTKIPWKGKPASQCPDGPRYKALGNSWTVYVVRWIGARIQWALDGADPEKCPKLADLITSSPAQSSFNAYGFEPGIARRSGDPTRFSHERAPTIRSNMGDNQTAAVLAFNHQSGGDFRPEVKEELANTLQRSQGQAVCLTVTEPKKRERFVYYAD